MILSYLFQAKLFTIFFIFGIVSSFFYDFIRLFRFYKIHGKILKSIEDLSYWLMLSTVFFNLLLYANNGELRLFVFMAFFTGHIMYFYTLSPYIFNAEKYIIHILIYIIRLFITIITTPFKLIWAVFERPVKFLCKLLYKLLISLKKYVKILLYKSNFLPSKRNGLKCQNTQKTKNKNPF